MPDQTANPNTARNAAKGDLDAVLYDFDPKKWCFFFFLSFS